MVGNRKGPLTPTLWNLPVVSAQAIATGDFLRDALLRCTDLCSHGNRSAAIERESGRLRKHICTIRAGERWRSQSIARLPCQIGEKITDFLEVESLKTFALGKDMKTRKSASIKVDAGEARQLEAETGLVSLGGKPGVIKDAEGGAPENGTKPEQKAKPDGNIEKTRKRRMASYIAAELVIPNPQSEPVYLSEKSHL